MTTTLPDILRQHFVVEMVLLLLFCSCKKKNDAVPQNNDEVKATVVLSSGSTITINATGAKASVAKDFYGITYVSGVNDANASVNVSFATVTNPGIYSHGCEYRVNAASSSTPVYVNASSFVANRGNVTITTVTDHHIEGTFTATCKVSMNATDSASVSGAFKGDY